MQATSCFKFYKKGKSMKNYLSIALLSCLFVLASGCALYVSEDSYAMAGRNEYVLKYPGLEASKDSLHSKVLQALQRRGWYIESDGNPIKAKLTEIRQTAIASFNISDNRVEVDTKGSMVDGNKPYVPKRYVDNVMATVRDLLKH